MKYKRLFTFGCSYTQYSSSTWANIVAWDLGIPYYQFGLSGTGNQSIFCRMVEADLEHTFTEDDLIMVVWSTWSREDRYLDYHWKAVGDIFNNSFYDDNFIKKYWSFSNDIIKNSTAIISANKMFKPQFQGHIQMPLIADLTNLDLTLKEKNLVNFYKPYIPLDNIFKYNNDTKFCKLYNDPHPDLLEHLKFTKEVIYKSLNLNIKPETEELCHAIYDEFINLLTVQGSNMTDNEKKHMLQRITPDLIEKYRKLPDAE